MEKEEVKTIYQRLKPAQETLEFMKHAEGRFDSIENMTQKVTTQIELMKKDIQSICEKLDENKEEHRAIMEKIDAFLEGCDGRYATKSFQNNIEKIGWALVFLIVGALVAAFFKLVLK